MGNLFEVDYLKRTVELFKESFSFKKYKAMNKFFAFCMAYLMSPLQCVSVIISVPLFCSAFALKFVVSIIKSLHNVVTNEGQKLKHATQLVVYIFSWPIIFIAYVMAALCYIGLVIMYALLACVSYVWTIGGFKFYAYIVDAENVAIEVDGKYTMKSQIILFIFTTVFALLPGPSLILSRLFAVCYSFLTMSNKLSAEYEEVIIEYEEVAE
jgi:hypothetical protein